MPFPKPVSRAVSRWEPRSGLGTGPWGRDSIGDTKGTSPIAHEHDSAEIGLPAQTCRILIIDLVIDIRDSGAALGVARTHAADQNAIYTVYSHTGPDLKVCIENEGLHQICMPSLQCWSS